ncbi:MAG TPA: hypothetical protein VMF58_13530 [Rhizomicrobium sp.]|nr:hypothetical protein [Rhizomicrobium sp.]
MQRIIKPDLKFVATPALLERGCVVVIGLEAIRDEAGARWDKMRNSIYLNLEALLRQKLSGTDYFSQLDDMSFLVSMPAASSDEAQILCVNVSHNLHKNLLGHCDLTNLRISRATRLDGDTLECMNTEGVELSEIAEKAGLKLGGNVVRDRFQSAQMSLAQGPPRPSTFRFTPLLDIQHEAVTAYRCDSLMASSLFEAIQPQPNFKSDLADLIARLRFATDALAKHLSAGQKYLLSLPISYELLGSPVARMEVASLCRNLSSAMRPYLQFEIGELPYGVPQSRLSELVSSLRPFCRGVTAYLPARIPSYAAYQGAGLSAIGLSLSAGVLANTDMSSEVFKLATSAQRLNLKSFVLDVPNCEMLLLAQRLKVSAASGQMIGHPMTLPEPVKRLALCDIITREMHAAETDESHRCETLCA